MCRLTLPHTLGIMKSLGSRSVNAIKLRVAVSGRVLQIDDLNETYSRAASETGILLRFRSSCSLWFSSVSLLSFSSAMDCFFDFPLSFVRISYGAAMVDSPRDEGRRLSSDSRERVMWMRGCCVLNAILSVIDVNPGRRIWLQVSEDLGRDALAAGSDGAAVRCCETIYNSSVNPLISENAGHSLELWFVLRAFLRAAVQHMKQRWLAVVGASSRASSSHNARAGLASRRIGKLSCKLLVISEVAKAVHVDRRARLRSGRTAWMRRE